MKVRSYAASESTMWLQCETPVPHLSPILAHFYLATGASTSFLCGKEPKRPLSQPGSRISLFRRHPGQPSRRGSLSAMLGTLTGISGNQMGTSTRCALGSIISASRAAVEACADVRPCKSGQVVTEPELARQGAHAIQHACGLASGRASPRANPEQAGPLGERGARGQWCLGSIWWCCGRPAYFGV